MAKKNNKNAPPRAVGIEQQIVLELVNGVRKPKNEKERRLLSQIKEIESRGRMVYLPFD